MLVRASDMSTRHARVDTRPIGSWLFPLPLLRLAALRLMALRLATLPLPLLPLSLLRLTTPRLMLRFTSPQRAMRRLSTFGFSPFCTRLGNSPFVAPPCGGRAQHATSGDVATVLNVRHDGGLRY